MTNERARGIVDSDDAPVAEDDRDAAPEVEPTEDLATGDPAADGAAPATEVLSAELEDAPDPDGEPEAAAAELADDDPVEDALAGREPQVELEDALIDDDSAGGGPEDEDEDDELDPVADASDDLNISADVAETDDADEGDNDDEDDGVADESLAQLLEAMLFVADEPVAPAALARVLECTPREVRRALDDLGDTLREANRGVRVQQGPDGAQLVTAPEAATAVELFLGLEANRRLSSAALETLAIIAYRQPVTRHVIEQIRGVSSDGAVATLRARGLIEGVGRAPGPGRPLLFSTTQRFLEHFGLERPDELPPLPDDVELRPDGHGPQMALEAAIDGEMADTSDTDSTAEQLGFGDDAEAESVDPEAVIETASIEAASSDDLEDDEFDEFDGLEDDPDLEISDDLDDLSRAAGAALAAPAASEPPGGMVDS